MIKRCQHCPGEGETKTQFKQRQFPRFGQIYYICRSCGKANRVSPEVLNPRQRGAKKIISVAREISRRYQQSIEEIKFKILVWGPSAENEEQREAFAKREEIRNLLGSKGMEAYFSEEIQVEDERGNPLPPDIAELLETGEFHLVINIAASYGSTIEAQKFTPQLLHRCLLWLPLGARGGFAAGLIAFLENYGMPPLYFDSDDVRSCVLTLMSEDWVDGLRMNELSLDIEEKRIQETRIIRKARLQ